MSYAAPTLEFIRQNLIRIEDTIIFGLIERAQFAHNAKIYDPGTFADVLHTNDFKGSWLDYFLLETEKVHAKMRRYEAPDEFPFSDPALLPKSKLPDYKFEERFLVPNGINKTREILRYYIEEIVPNLSQHSAWNTEDDNEYGSSMVADVNVLQAIARRVHLGEFVSEIKYREDPGAFEAAKGDPAALERLIRKPDVEKALFERVRRKGSFFGQELSPSGEPLESRATRVNVEKIVDLYRDFIVPLTRAVEVEYLQERLRRVDAGDSV